MNRWILAAVAVLAFAPLSFARDLQEEQRTRTEKRLQNAHDVLQDTLHVREGIPQDLLDKARCVVIMPSALKAAFVFGGSYGRGTMVCRTGEDLTGRWGKPAMYALEGGSFGFQIGGQATDLILLVMNPRGVDSLLHSKVKLGGDVSIAAGPVGREFAANTDAYLRSEILSYSRTRGVFAGVSLEGSTLRPDNHANHTLYGRNVSATDIVKGSEIPTPNGAHELLALLDNVSPKRA